MRLICFLFSCLLAVGAVRAQSLPRVTARELSQRIQSPGDRVRIYNFWATWCAPCVKEMPLFENFQRAHPEVEMVFVSLDLNLDADPTKVVRFITRKKIESEVILLDEADPNSWIDLIEKKWSGALPATLVVNPKSGVRVFEQREFKDGELDALVARVK
jgi:thiol-disulfide isomerase/thioredoxin